MFRGICEAKAWMLAVAKTRDLLGMDSTDLVDRTDLIYLHLWVFEGYLCPYSDLSWIGWVHFGTG